MMRKLLHRRVWIPGRRLRTGFFYSRHGNLPGVEYMLKVQWGVIVEIFILFRIFDIAKPWPVKQSQDFRTGWGVTIDDLLAAIYVNLCSVILYAVLPTWR